MIIHGCDYDYLVTYHRYIDVNRFAPFHSVPLCSIAVRSASVFQATDKDKYCVEGRGTVSVPAQLSRLGTLLLNSAIIEHGDVSSVLQCRNNHSQIMRSSWSPRDAVSIQQVTTSKRVVCQKDVDYYILHCLYRR